jgi:cell division protein FtsQ
MRLPVLPPTRRPPAPAVAACVATLALLGGAWLWLRDSSLVAVKRVTVTGASGSDAPRVRAGLQDNTRDMTTLHVRHGALATAVEPFPAGGGVDPHADFPHGLRIVVHERVAVATIASASGQVPVAADGTLLRGSAGAGLPIVNASAAPTGDTLGDRRIEPAVALLAKAPPALRARVRRVYLGPRGLTAPLRDGPVLYFGGSDRMRAKWAAAARVLADSTSAGATYLDVRLPERPAAGGLEAQHEIDSEATPQVGAQPAQPDAQQGTTP